MKFRIGIHTSFWARAYTKFGTDILTKSLYLEKYNIFDLHSLELFVDQNAMGFYQFSSSKYIHPFLRYLEITKPKKTKQKKTLFYARLQNT